MRSAWILACVVLLVVPWPASAEPGRGAADLDRLQWPYPQYPPPPRYPPSYPPPGPRYPGPVAVSEPLTEDEWSRWMLRAQDQVSECRRNAVIGFGFAAAGFALAASNEHNPSPAELAAGRTEKMETFASTVGVVSMLGGGVALMSGGRCATYNRSLVEQLEREGRHRGFGPPVPEQLSRSEWLQRLAQARGNASLGKWMAFSGGMAMAAGGAAMAQYHPRPDQRGAVARLGPGIVLFTIGYGVAIGGTVLWSNETRRADALAARPPKSAVSLRIAPRGRGVQARLLIGF